MAEVPLIVTAEWLKGALTAGDKNLVVLDTTWLPSVKVDAIPYPDTTHKELYESKHIPGALHFDLDAGIIRTQLIPRNLPEPAAFQQYVRQLGIGADSHVVCYDRDDGVIIQTTGAARTRFTFKLYGHEKVSVLDGGLLHWEAQGYDTEQGPAPVPEPGDLEVQPRADMTVDFDTMRQIEAVGSHQIVDTRLEVNFNAEEPEPCLFSQLSFMDGKFPLPTDMKAGHMEGAVNISFYKLLKDGILYKSKEDIHKLLVESGVDFDKPIIATCYIGYTATMLALVASYCGLKDTRVYIGSWTEYGQRTASC